MKRYSGFIGNFKDRAVRLVSDGNLILEQRRQIEKVISGKFRKYEPSLTRLYSDVRTRASKMGVPVDNLENRFVSSYRLTVDKLEKISRILPFFKKDSSPNPETKASGKKKEVKRPSGRAKSAPVSKSSPRKKSKATV